MSNSKLSTHPIDVTYGDWVDSAGRPREGFMINLVQENPSYSPEVQSSEHVLCFTTRKALERFLTEQGLHAVYDDEAEACLDDDE